MTKGRAPALILVLSLAAGAFAQEESPIDLTALNADITTLFTSLGRDLSPRLHQIAMSGNDLVGEARLRGLTRFTLSAAGVSLTAMDGFGKALAVDPADDPDYWKFSLISIPALIEENLASAGSMAEDGFGLATGGAFPMPVLRFGMGFPLPGKLEFLGNGFYLSMALAEKGAGLFGLALPESISGLGADLQMITAGAIIRKPILSDKKGFWRPSLSVGASYTYSKFDFAVDEFSLDAMGMDPIAIEGMGDLTMDGSMGFHTQINSLGAIVHLSKTIFWVLTPFAKLGVYYHISDYESSFKVSAVVTPEDVGDDPITQELDAPVRIHSEDVSFIASSGLEVKLLPITLTLCASLDLERPVVEIPAIDLGDMGMDSFKSVKLNGLGLTAALRIQI